ncbi:MAG: hypothetical protein LC776_06110 [Acidobacteria bacterium]|nr:hypothetical protein [Acidobacteriota bacterium]
MRTLPVVLLLGLFSMTVHAQKSVRDRDGFRSPVKTVRTEHTWAATRDGKYVEGERGIPGVHSYDASGNKIEIAYYNIDGSPGNKLVYTRNLGRKVTELVHYGPDGISHYKSVYTHDNEGNTIEQTHYKADGSLNVSWVRTYDERGNKTKEVMNGGGRVLRTDEWTYSYDKRGKASPLRRRCLTSR